jgi:hypothetical protein
MATKTSASPLSGISVILPGRCILLFTTVAIGLLAKRIWNRCRPRRTKKGSLGSTSSEPSTAGSSRTTEFLQEVVNAIPTIKFSREAVDSTKFPQEAIDTIPTTRFPQEVVGMIVAHLIYDTHSLLACSLTSRFWYLAAVPHLHRTLTVQISDYIPGRPHRTEWPRPLQAGSDHGWLPLVTRLFITASCSKRFSQELFCSSTRHEFSALTNVQELSITCLDIPGFIPEIQQYFGQFSQSLRSLTLKEPKGSHQQIVFFIRQFPHLEDLELYLSLIYAPEKPGYWTLAPPFVLPFRGRLRINCTAGDGLAEAMVHSFGGAQFRHLDLFYTDGGQLLLDTCADTLETLHLCATGLRGEKTLFERAYKS